MTTLQKSMRQFLPIFTFVLSVLLLTVSCKTKEWHEFEIQVDYSAIDVSERNVTDAEVESVLITSLKKRLDAVGVDEARLAKIGPGRFKVNFQTNKKTKDVPEYIFRQGKIELKMCDDNLTQKVGKHFQNILTSHKDSYTDKTPANLRKELIKLSNLPHDYQILFTMEEDIRIGASTFPSPIVVKRKPELTGNDLTEVFSTIQDGQAVISFSTLTEGRRKLKDATSGRNIGKAMAIVFDDRILSMPVIKEPIVEGIGTISGTFTVREAHDIASLIQMGSLPIPIQIIEKKP